MKILCIGDVVGSNGCRFLRAHLPSLKKVHGVDFTIVNGENSADGNGITPESAEFLFSSGADAITTGNHVFRKREIYEFLDENEAILRPENFGASAPGHGVYIADLGRVQIGVLNLMGTMYLEALDSPFDALEAILRKEKLPKITVLDFHAEATSEKRAMGFFADGKLSAVFGTHTHVPTADACILPMKTGYITDVGMTGTEDSVLGVKKEIIIGKFRTHMPAKFEYATGACRMDCVLFCVEEETGRTLSCERFSVS